MKPAASSEAGTAVRPVAIPSTRNGGTTAFHPNLNRYSNYENWPPWKPFISFHFLSFISRGGLLYVCNGGRLPLQDNLPRYNVYQFPFSWELVWACISLHEDGSRIAFFAKNRMSSTGFSPGARTWLSKTSRNGGPSAK